MHCGIETFSYPKRGCGWCREVLCRLSRGLRVFCLGSGRAGSGLREPFRGAVGAYDPGRVLFP